MSQIYKKMSEVMKEIGHIGKDQKNQAQGFKFRGVDQFVNALYPALTKHGVFMAPRCTSKNVELKEVERSSGKKGIDKHVELNMEYDFFAEDGSRVTIGPIPSEGLDSGDKATNKALSAALKYALIQTFSIPTEDMAEADLETPSIRSQVVTEGRKEMANALQDKGLIKTSEEVLSVINTGTLTSTATPATTGSKSFRKPKATTEEL